MRTAILGLALCACSVPDKKAAPDGGAADAQEQTGKPGDAPETTITAGPPEFSSNGAATFEFASDMPGATFECKVDAEAPAACTSPLTRTLADGPHSFSVRAQAPDGQVDATPAEKLWSIDTIAPDTMLTTVPPGADNSVMVSFGFASNEKNTAFDCSLDGASYVTCDSDGTFGPVGDGAHSFAVRAHDRAGNVDSSPAVYAWTVDTSTPDTQLLTGPTGESGTTTASFTFVSPDAGAGATFQCRLDTAAFAACTSPRDLSGLTEGPHTFQVRVKDAVGNFDPTPASRTWEVDLTPPDTQITAGPTGTVSSASASFAFSASETPVTYQCSLDNAAYATCTSPASFSMLAQGAHTFAVRATDGAMHTDATPAMASWTVDTAPPDIMVTSGPVMNGTSGPYVVFAFTVSEGAASCAVDGGAFAACASPFAVNLPAGAHAVKIKATDGAMNAAQVNRMFSVACAAPDAAGAAGVLHLDDGMQAQANAVTGGAGATLGDTAMAEPSDPAALAQGRFGGALAFTAAEGDHVSWPVALPAMTDFTLELWAKPDANAGARDIAVTGDGSLALRATADSPSTVTISVSAGAVTATSASIAAGAWHHVLASRSGTALHLWVDGVRTDATNAAAVIDLSTLTLGGAGAKAFGGALDEVWLAQTAIATDDAALPRYCPL